MDPAAITPPRRRADAVGDGTCYALLLGARVSASAVAWLADAARPDRDTVVVIGVVPASTSCLPGVSGLTRRLQRARAARRASGVVRQLGQVAPRLTARTMAYGSCAVEADALVKTADVVVLPVDAWKGDEVLLDREVGASRVTTILVPPHTMPAPHRHQPVIALSSNGQPNAARFGLGWAATHDTTLVAATFLPRRVRNDEWAGADPATCETHEQLRWERAIATLRDGSRTPVTAEVLDDDLPTTLHRLARTARILVVDREDYEAWRTQLYEDLLPHGSCALVVLAQDSGS